MIIKIPARKMAELVVSLPKSDSINISESKMSKLNSLLKNSDLEEIDCSDMGYDEISFIHKNMSEKDYVQIISD